MFKIFISITLKKCIYLNNVYMLESYYRNITTKIQSVLFKIELLKWKKIDTQNIDTKQLFILI